MASPAPRKIPRDVEVVGRFLKEMGITDYEPSVLNHLVEFTYKKLTDVLKEAYMLSKYAEKKTVDVNDVKLALCFEEMKQTVPPSKGIADEMARSKNLLPLTCGSYKSAGLKLPASRYCLTQCNYHYLHTKKKMKRHSCVPREIPSNLCLSERRENRSDNNPAFSSINVGSSITSLTQGTPQPDAKSFIKNLQNITFSRTSIPTTVHQSQVDIDKQT